MLHRLPASLGPGRRRRSGRFELLGPIAIDGFDRPRLVRVYVPFQAGPAGRRPTLVMFDGQNIFHDEPSFAGGWHLHDAVDKMAARRLPAPVVIAIDHGNERRLDELSPWKYGEVKGSADRFIAWIAETLLPELRPEYGLHPDPSYVGVGGSSMGGLAALYAHLKLPGVFGGALCISPAFWWAHRRIFEEAVTRPLPHPSRIYIDCGAHEAGGQMLVIARQMAELLRWRGYPGECLRFRGDKRGQHTERDWRRRSPAALRFMFQGRFLAR